MFLNGITVILSGNREAFEGATIAWATKIEKNHALVSLPAEAAITNHLGSNNIFSINVLGEHQADIARQYGGRKQSRPLQRNPDDLIFDMWAVPIVKNCRANLLCNAQREIAIAEQRVVIARIEKFDLNESIAPLNYDHASYFD